MEKCLFRRLKFPLWATLSLPQVLVSTKSMSVLLQRPLALMMPLSCTDILGLRGWYSKFIPLCCRTALCTAEKNTEFKWNDEAQEAFTWAKELIAACTVWPYSPNYDCNRCIWSQLWLQLLCAILGSPMTTTSFSLIMLLLILCLKSPLQNSCMAILSTPNWISKAWLLLRLLSVRVWETLWCKNRPTANR